MAYSSNQLYRAAQIREAEAIAFKPHGVSSLQLMRQAGQAVFDELQRRWPNARKIAVCCGVGNNGGDGYVVARLALQAGMQVTLQAAGDVTLLQYDGLACSREFVAAGGRIDDATGDFSDCDVIVDALLGTGLNRQVGDTLARLIAAINAADCPVIAVDVPSGLHADTGCAMGVAVQADVCVTFIGLKCGMFSGQAVDYCGDIVLAPLDFPAELLAGFSPVAHLLPDGMTMPKRQRSSHKGYHGHLLLIGGNLGFSGAVRLAAEAALRSGAGLVSVATRCEHAGLLNIGRPELMCHGVESPEQLQALISKASVVVIGPGLGQDDWAQSLFEQVMASDLPCIIDADALSLLAKTPINRENCLLTPHPGEAARLLGRGTQEVGADRYAAVRQLQQRFKAVSVLKGAGTLIADDETIWVNTTGNPGMATGGMGDVLAGICGALIAQHFSLSDAAKLAVNIHGKAADLAAADSGERGLLAGDLFHFIRQLLN
jgi:NAD(P)H-hydrate epimerase